MTGCWSALNIYLPGLSDVDLKEDQPWVTDEEQPWLTESSLDLVGEGTRGEATSNRGVSHIPGQWTPNGDIKLEIILVHSSLPSKLENSPLSLGSAGDNEHIQRILNLHKTFLATRKCTRISVTSISTRTRSLSMLL